MTIVNISFDGVRIDESGSSSTRVNIGGGAGSTDEPDLKFQGSEDSSRKVGTSAAGFAITPVGVDISTATGSYQTLIAKYAIGNWSALDTVALSGVQLRYGSAASAVANYDIDGIDTYPIKGGFVVKGVNPNIVGYRTSTSGSPSFSNADYFGIVASLNSASKGENVVLSAIDVGNGYHVTGGGGADPTVTLSDISSYDETLANRYGMFLRLEGKDNAYVQLGGCQFGTSAAAVDYQDSERATIYVAASYSEAGWSNITDNVENADTVISPTGLITYISEGSSSGATDDRAVYKVVGSAATLSRSNMSLINFAEFAGASVATYENIDVEVSSFKQLGSTLNNTILRPLTTSGVAMCSDFTIDDTTNLTLKQSGSGHAIDYGNISSSSSILWTVKTEGFTIGSSGNPVTTTSVGDETILIDVDSGQTFTITVESGASIPSINNTGAGDVVVIVPEVSFNFNVSPLITGYEWRLGVKDPISGKLYATELDGEETATSSSQSYSYSYISDTEVVLQIISDGYEEVNIFSTLTSSNQNINVILTPEVNS